MTTCPQCHHDLPDGIDEESGSCPRCGHAWAQLRLQGSGGLEFTKSEIGYGIEKSWLEQWGRVERGYSMIQDLYRASTVHNQDAQSVVQDFFIHCWHLSDWLKKDSSTNVQFGDIGTLLDNEFDLKVCNVLANTVKHLESNKLTARVSAVSTDAPVKVTIEVTTATGTQDRDALDLARSCIDIWRKFLQFHGLNP